MPNNDEEAKTKANEILKEYVSELRNEDYDKCLKDLEEILDLCDKFSFGMETEYTILDKKHFVLQKAGKYRKALKIAFDLEELSVHTKRALSPWNYLKIADSYLGLNDTVNSLKYIKKAVLERDFENYKHLMGEHYSLLHSNKSYIDVIELMRKKIGLDDPAKNFSLPLVGGGTFTFTENIGKVILIDFWDMKCAPCIKAIPELNKLHEKYSNEGLKIIGISLDTEREELISFLEEKRVTYTIACSYMGWEDPIVDLYRIKATPSTWLADREGILRYYNPDYNDLEELICELLKE